MCIWGNTNHLHFKYICSWINTHKGLDIKEEAPTLIAISHKKKCVQKYCNLRRFWGVVKKQMWCTTSPSPEKRVLHPKDNDIIVVYLRKRLFMTLKKVVLICIWCFYNAFYNLFWDETEIMYIAKMQKKSMQNWNKRTFCSWFLV